MDNVAMAARRLGDVDLARRCVSGDRLAQKRVFQEQKKRVHALLYRILGSNSEIDDLAQEALLEVFRSLPTFRGDALLSTWVERITVRVAYAYMARRRNDVVRLSLVPEPVSGDASAEERALVREAARRLYALLDQVETKQRIAYTLHVIDGRPLADVAVMMDASAVTTKVRAWRVARFVEKRAKQDPLLARFVVGEEK